MWQDGGMPEISIVHEDRDYYVIDKPAGLAVQGGAGIKRSLIEVLEAQTGAPVYLVHRLDRDTSGLLLIARDARSAHRWTSLFADGKGQVLRKRYLAACAGVFSKDSGHIDEPVRVRGVVRQARTSWRCLATEGDVSLLELELGTGRMHQIRIHLQKAGHPILGDDKYGDFPLNRHLRKEKGLKNLLLHAWRLDIALEGAPPLSLEAPLPASFSRVLSPETLSRLGSLQSPLC